MSNDPAAASDTARLPNNNDEDAADDNDNESQIDGSPYDDIDAEPSSRNNGAGDSASADAEAASSRPGRRSRKRRSSSKIRRAKAGIAKKIEYTTHLMSSLDVVVFAELCVLYYMEYVVLLACNLNPSSVSSYYQHSLTHTNPINSCSFFRLLIRALLQYMYLTPKPSEFLKLLPAPRPQMYTIFGANLICMLSHIVLALPEASETMRGYLHGGVIIDFIGQKAPTSRIGLLLLDVGVLVLQCVMCAVWVEKDKLRQIETTLKRVSAGGIPKRAATTAGAVDVTTGAATFAAQTPSVPAPPPIQDLDAEERGVLRNDPLDGEDIEMQPLVPPERTPAAAAGDGDSGSAPPQQNIEDARYRRILRNVEFLGGSQAEEGPDRPSLYDVLLSGNGLLANLHVVHSIRTLIAANTTEPLAAAYPIQLAGYGSRIAQLQAQLERRTRPRPSV